MLTPSSDGRENHVLYACLLFQTFKLTAMYAFNPLWTFFFGRWRADEQALGDGGIIFL